MALLETLMLQVGSVIAKAIFKLWLNPADAPGDLSADLIDLLKDRTEDVFVQRNGIRQFEAIGDKVAASLLTIFEAESRNLDENGQAAVTSAVFQTLNYVKIDPTLLAKRNLDPNQLAKYLLSSTQDGVRHFSASETALYQRVIAESCRFIVDIASQLPSFSERTFAEVLRREDQILSVANQILEESHRIQQGILGLKGNAAYFETQYRHAVIRSLDRLELFGLDVSTASRRHRLSVAYVTLSVVRTGPSPRQVVKPGQDPTSNTIDASLYTHQEDAAIANSPKTVSESVNQALLNSRRLFVSGMAGSGKTTLLQWLAVKSASRDFPEQLKSWNDSVPFFIQLRRYTESDLPTPELFPRLVAPMIADTMPRHWVHEQLKSERGIVLVDGIDEVSQARRQVVYQWLENLVETFKYATFIVTARPHAVANKWLVDHDFDIAELQPMELPAIDEFIDYWHRAVRAELIDVADIADLETLPANLKSTLRRNRSMRNLATNPLLCAMLCALNRDRRYQLPSDRIELYEAGFQMLLERRDIERQIQLQDYPRLNYRQKRALLQDLAYWMLKNGWSEVAQSRAETRLTNSLSSMEGVPKATNGPAVCRIFVERSGVLREINNGRLDFAHRTFQEFLSAQAALDEDDIGVLVNNAHDDNWREVIILAAGLATAKARDELIDALITRGDSIGGRDSQRIHLIAIACLETAIRLSPQVRAKVQKRMAKLIPPKNVDEAKSLASAGELSVPYLAAQKGIPDYSASLCIRTLLLIGGDSALDALTSYVSDKREGVIAELFEGWSSFDRGEYAQRVLKPLIKHHPRLVIKYIPSLEGFEFLGGLAKLEIHNCSSIEDLSPLASLTELTMLSLKNCPCIRDLHPLSSLDKLVRLEITDAVLLRDLSPLANLKNLKYLSLSGCRGIKNISPLASAENLEELALWGCQKITSLKSLRHHKNLWQIYGVSPEVRETW